jgi:ADP-ribosylglycohydrolase/protein-tyrosine phosphatase
VRRETVRLPVVTAATSETDPIRVSMLLADMTELRGTIGLTFAPGKVDGGRWNRSLDTDLKRLREVYGTGLLVTLLEDHELRMLGIEGLFTAAERHDIKTHRFPIRDLCAPPKPTELIPTVRAVLDAAHAGTNVVIHCRGGLGRAGTVSACVLTALGHDPDLAIEVVRIVRPGAVETNEQEQFITRFAQALRHAGEKKPAVEPSPSFDRIAGCLLGGALGDALGYPIEFSKNYVEWWGFLKKLGEGAPELRISDDTQMTLFSVEGLVRSHLAGAVEPEKRAEFLLGAYQRWHATQAIGATPKPGKDRGWLAAESGLYSRRAPGNTCMSALAASFTRPKVSTVADPPNGSKGCGAVMRAAPFGLAMPTREKAFETARDAGALTHGHPSGYLPAAYLASLVWDLSRKGELLFALERADELLAKESEHEETAEIIERARKLTKGGRCSLETIVQIGEGWVGHEALAIGLASVLVAREPESESVGAGLWVAAAHPGDSDSTAAIAGNLLGAMYGVLPLPGRWLELLEMREVIMQAARDLFAATVLGSNLDTDAYPRVSGRFAFVN